MDYNIIEHLGTIDFSFELKPYINKRIKETYTLNEKDRRSIITGDFTENVIHMREAQEALEKELKQILKEFANMKATILKCIENNKYVKYSIEDYESDVTKYKQRLDDILIKVLKAQEGQQIVAELVEISKEENISRHEIDEANKEINEIQKGYMNVPQNESKEDKVTRED